MISLLTKRLVLRPWTEDDFDAYLAMATDPAVMEFIGTGVPNTTESARAKFEATLAAWETQGFGLLAVEVAAESHGRPIGFAGLGTPDFLPEILPAIELGWRFTSSAWGQGFATEAAGSVMDWAFETMELERVVSVIHQGNVRSQRVAEKLGMTVERRTVVPKARAWVEVYERFGADGSPE